MGTDGGVFGVFGHREAADIVAVGLSAMGHRGVPGPILDQPGTPSRGSRPTSSAVGLVLPQRGWPPRTTLSHSVRTAVGTLTLASAGRLVNARSLERDLLASGAVLTGSSDEELLVHLVAHSPQRTLINRLVDALVRARGGFSILLQTEERMVAVRDSLGLRPLVVGRSGTTVLVATESRAIHAVGGAGIREVEPGEMLILDEDGLTSLHPFPRRDPRPCLREVVGLAHTDSTIHGFGCYETRRELGARLADTSPVQADLVTSLASAPSDAGSSGRSGAAAAAAGFAERARIPFLPGLVAEPEGHAMHGIGGRSEPAVLTVSTAVRGKRVVLLHHSVGPETPLGAAVRSLRHAGAKAIHVRLASPATTHPCIYGVPIMPDRAQVPASKTADQVRDELGVDSFAWFDREGLLDALGCADGAYCTGCYGGDFPLVHEDLDEPQLPLFGNS